MRQKHARKNVWRRLEARPEAKVGLKYLAGIFPMNEYTRRKFIREIGAFSTLLLAGQTAFSLPDFMATNEDFEILVVGDSIIAGQGLTEKDRFYSHIKNWLQKEMFGERRKVNLTNYSHSGSRIYLSENEKKALSEANRKPDEFHYSELNVSFPDMKTQIDVAARNYKNLGKTPKEIDLIMLTGGLTNLNTAYILNGFKKNKNLGKKIDESCNELMFKFLNYTAEIFPNSLITVIGYYPIVSEKSSSHQIYNGILELFEFPRSAKPIVNNLLTKQFFKLLHKKMNKRSKIWFEDSNIALQTAVNRLNKKHKSEQAIFIKSPIDAETCYGTKKTFLWGVGKKGRTNDSTYDERLVECSNSIDGLKDVKLKFNKRFCELSAIGHPNIEGSKAYAETIKKSLKSKFSTVK